MMDTFCVSNQESASVVLRQRLNALEASAGSSEIWLTAAQQQIGTMTERL